jgi:hypothetical protein
MTATAARYLVAAPVFLHASRDDGPKLHAVGTTVDLAPDEDPSTSLIAMNAAAHEAKAKQLKRWMRSPRQADQKLRQERSYRNALPTHLQKRVAAVEAELKVERPAGVDMELLAKAPMSNSKRCTGISAHYR